MAVSFHCWWPRVLKFYSLTIILLDSFLWLQFFLWDYGAIIMLTLPCLCRYVYPRYEAYGDVLRMVGPQYCVLGNNSHSYGCSCSYGILACTNLNIFFMLLEFGNFLGADDIVAIRHV